jgi:hypothetical protein
MSLINRAKFFAAIDSSNYIAPVSAFGDSWVIPTFTNSEHYSYYLEKSGQFELGVYRPGEINQSLRRQIIRSSAAISTDRAFSEGDTGLTCTLLPTSFAFVDTRNLSAPAARSDGFAVGGGILEMSSPGGAALGGTVNENASFSVALGINSSAVRNRVTALGYSAIGERFRSTCVGANSVSGLPGEVALGSYLSSHLTSVPVFALPDAFSTSTNRLVTFEDETSGGSAGAPIGPIDFQITRTYLAAAFSSRPFGVRIQGTVMCEHTDPNNRRVFGVDFAILKDTLLYSSFTSLFVGSNAPVMAMSLDANNRVQITTPALDGLQVRGLLQLSKIAFSA